MHRLICIRIVCRLCFLREPSKSDRKVSAFCFSIRFILFRDYSLSAKSDRWLTRPFRITQRGFWNFLRVWERSNWMCASVNIISGQWTVSDWVSNEWYKSAHIRSRYFGKGKVMYGDKWRPGEERKINSRLYLSLNACQTNRINSTLLSENKSTKKVGGKRCPSKKL